MTFETFVLLMVFAHYVGDYVIQPRFVAETKGKEWYNMLAHCVLYTGSVGWVLVEWANAFPYVGLVCIFVSHWIIDGWKCRGLEKESSHVDNSYLYADQAYHFIVLLALIIWYGWFR